MSRIIKFRAFGPNCGVMWDWEQTKNLIRELGWEGEKILMQYTGLKDKNGVEIYESDLVRVMDNKHGALQIEFKNDYVGGWVLTHPTTANHVSLGARHSEEIEVIGNIHESPELIGG